jgi:cellobiose-specific phosphotransferase system component IIC
MSIVFVIFEFAIQALVWYPFFKAYEKKKVAEEAAAAEAAKAE